MNLEKEVLGLMKSEDCIGVIGMVKGARFDIKNRIYREQNKIGVESVFPGDDNLFKEIDQYLS